MDISVLVFRILCIFGSARDDKINIFLSAINGMSGSSLGTFIWTFIEFTIHEHFEH